jgi:hypothetical protein
MATRAGFYAAEEGIPVFVPGLLSGYKKKNQGENPMIYQEEHRYREYQREILESVPVRQHSGDGQCEYHQFLHATSFLN